MNIKEYYRSSFWKSLPTKSYFKLLVAIFFTFSTIGFINDLWNSGQRSLEILFINVVYSGLVSVGYAHGAMRNWKFIPAVLALQLFFSFISPVSSADFPIDDMIKNRLILDGFGILIAIIVGYVFFLIFISGEGIPHVRLKTEMDLAKEMHDVLVPPIQFQNEKFSIYGDSIPTSEVGGDLLDIFESENSLTCYMVDVSGYGVAASLLMGMFKSAFHTVLQKDLPLSTTINDVNQSLYKLKKPTMFLTASVIRFNKNNHTAEFSVAGHLPILHYQARSQSIQYLTIKQIPLSVKSDYVFKTQTINYENDDIFLFLTDGLTEVLNSKKEEFGIKRIEALLIENNSQSSRQIFEILLNEVRQHGEQRDDQTMMILRCLK